MAFAQTDLDSINAAIASGKLTVRFQEEEVTYRSVSDLLKAKSVIEKELADQNNTVPVRQHRCTTDRGW